MAIESVAGGVCFSTGTCACNVFVTTANKITSTLVNSGNVLSLAVRAREPCDTIGRGANKRPFVCMLGTDMVLQGRCACEGLAASFEVAFAVNFRRLG